MVLKIKMTEPPHVEDGEYLAVFEGAEQIEGRFGPALRLSFRLLEPPYTDVIVTTLATATLTPGSKLEGFIVPLVGRPLSIGEEIDLDELKGTPVVIYVENTKDSRGVIYSNATKARKPREAELSKIKELLSSTTSNSKVSESLTVSKTKTISEEDIPF